MGLVYAKIKLSNPRKPELLPIEVTSLVDSGAIHLCISEAMAFQLELETQEFRNVQTADEKMESWIGEFTARFRTGTSLFLRSYVPVLHDFVLGIVILTLQ